MSDFPNSFDVPGRLVDGLDFLDGLTLNDVLQGSHACEVALGVDPWLPSAGSQWNFPGVQQVSTSLKEMARVEAGEVTVWVPADVYGSYDIALRNPGMFTTTSTNSVPFVIFGQWASRDGEAALFDLGDDPWRYPILLPRYDGTGALWGFRVKPLPTGVDEESAILRYCAMEVNW
ncbi:MAG: hypothetical protein HQ519_00055 [Planctomycetes bacterium]|nr:hypothetical protein [Planctomycetota bacterium]